MSGKLPNVFFLFVSFPLPFYIAQESGVATSSSRTSPSLRGAALFIVMGWVKSGWTVAWMGCGSFLYSIARALLQGFCLPRDMRHSHQLLFPDFPNQSRSVALERPILWPSLASSTHCLGSEAAGHDARLWLSHHSLGPPKEHALWHLDRLVVGEICVQYSFLPLECRPSPTT